MIEKKGKFSALADLQRHPVNEEVAVEIPQPMLTPPSAAAGRGRGRPATGKRSNPDWKLYSHFLKKQTQRAAVARLQAEDGGQDLSDVLEELLTQWIKR
ncbi:MAG: hypothetical protein EOO38_27910 [Cytophagaceae bacterium]|nr:MAG: hypothetical protein EOO38_27910 [Cytophagaceae bacterium]